ncbi:MULTISPECIES: hypothetical protein [unclassified Streptomyces]|uniref:hypothetical protein n=1 Tax=unclassified Streptomyces TaxID=2593676 RepID=UPI002256B621|nr:MULTISPECIES: hypothetical protein [unclassified Streptomyces]MCX5441745.1 hypothetical protein [Streptomyces sp. NBC_00063]WUB91984.1 hypothetical protein OHO83_06390 [Streptomyces sp. NBC_00569]
MSCSSQSSAKARPDSSAGLVYLVLHDVDSKPRARGLAAAPHTALYGDLEPLARAVPRRPDDTSAHQAVRPISRFQNS